MGINTSNISKSYDSDSILNHIINCANCALQNEDAFQKAMFGLAGELRHIFESEYCSIGTISNGYAEESIFSFETFEDKELSEQQKESLEAVKRVNIYDDSSTVSLALRSDERISWFYPSRMNGFGYVERYQKAILPSRDVNNVCVIPIRDNANQNYGFIQLINVKNQIDYNHDVSPYMRALLGLVQIIINNQKNKQELIRKENRLRDAAFYNQMQNKRDDVNGLLNNILEYLSEQFNAAVVSFRIPIINADKKEPLFYLRRVFVHSSIKNKSELIHRYYTERLVKDINEMNITEQLKCRNEGDIIEAKSDKSFSNYGIRLDDKTLIMPIFQRIETKSVHPQKNNCFCKANEHHDCIDRFKRLYGIFRLRISKTSFLNGSNVLSLDYNETKNRLSYLSKQITLLIDSIVSRFENESLKIFQNELKNSFFIKINDFDNQCVQIIKKTLHSKECSIYRYDNQTHRLFLSATTAKTIQFLVNNMILYFQTHQIQDSCFISTKASNNIIAKTYDENKKPHSQYVFNILDPTTHQSPFIERFSDIHKIESALAVPMTKKDGSCAGVVLLLGKEEHSLSFSTSYWEHDIKHVEFIVNILTRISESDTERLTFLSQLSHELLAPVTEQVYDNDLTVNLANRNANNFTKKQLILKLCENIDRNMLFKYIISDTEFIYSSTVRNIDYNIVKQEKPQAILLDAIRLMEKDAHAKSLSIKTFIAQMPPLWFDKERMMQVFINLLKNAIRYSDSHTSIRITYYNRENGFHEISFSNIGLGILEKEKEIIFELFHRGEAVKKKFTRGTGMGLYIVREIMRTHGGDCYVRHLNYPTEFVITLPNKD